MAIECGVINLTGNQARTAKCEIRSRLYMQRNISVAYTHTRKRHFRTEQCNTTQDAAHDQ